jgi:CRISPR-associated protein Csm2
MLKPKLAYAVGRVRQKNQKCKERRIEDFAEIISYSIDITVNSMNKDEAFKNFISFFEAIVAYHKRYGKE